MDNKRLDLVKSALEKVHSGDSITGHELNVALEELPPMIDFLGHLGEKYHLAWKELYLDLQTLESFKRARERRG